MATQFRMLCISRLSPIEMDYSIEEGPDELVDPFWLWDRPGSMHRVFDSLKTAVARAVQEMASEEQDL
jgi:hypothetical protein